MTAADIGTGIAMVLVIEGLVYALAPSLVERLLEALRLMPIDARRALGLATLATGMLLLWIFRG
ncbi:hypothetical protein AL036_04555 [Salipiger aestuarii]|uniref:DUF2065 domain-containing protein n=1 Tax=Salipiger aestuarii TaxID=568098 RepID=A0A327YKD0_9RHOB|nr:DUF2065 domain-containing protein [Salipiger aestuarii]EIE50404.1 hypothetical protein C357_13562 [Citreicella sp. 357]KAA8609325.1 hypothetical protein AL036_04555 [Salipiger aestuarii]KAA8615138.1 hypothetical protein AL037_02780 [Salipiger aestuarii]KAB2542937.1 hypothetical protein AL035_04835 [Salipiger aestuarii]RAK20862.1 hypothetical protein ATI53_1005111 [Salipiger aestuarii]